MGELEVSRATVFGFGRTGRAVVEFLLDRGVEPFVTDAGPLSAEARDFLSARSVPYEEGGHTLRVLEGTELIILSPGVDPRLPVLEEARARGLPVVSELDLAAGLLRDRPIVAVTGTNGKSTTVKLVEAILRSLGVNAVSAGNIGTPAITIVDRRYDALVLEVSSFQLEQSHALHPRVGVLLNISPDHLDRHRTMAEYEAVKLRLFANQTANDIAVLPGALSRKIEWIKAKRVHYEDVPLPTSTGFAELLPHNRANLQAAIAAAQGIIPFDPDGLRFPELEDAFSLPFRMYIEGVLGGALVVNDSKSTNAASTIAALRGFTRPVVLILGGRHKRAGYDALAREIAERGVRRTVLYGEAADYLADRLRAAGVGAFTITPDLPAAVKCAVDNIFSGGVLLFSPGCSSYDQFRNYEERGEAFSRLVRSHPRFKPTARI